MNAPLVGIGFDAHRFSKDPQRVLYVAGLKWEGVGLEGDSDADVVIHALIDALLSAVHAGDIGSFFGVGSQSRAADMRSTQLLKEVVDFIHHNSYAIIGASVVTIGNRPHLSTRRTEAHELLSRILTAPVSLTATTTDHMGFTGNGEGLAAMAIAHVANALV